MKYVKFLFITMLFFATASFGQALKASTGSSTGTYSRQAKEISLACINTIQLQEVNSTGSIQNIDRLVGNEVNAIWTQADVLFYRARTEDLSNIKTLVALAPEEVHIVKLTQAKEKEGGFGGIGGSPIRINNINDLAGRKVVAAGGSYVTAQVIRLQTEINFSVIEANTNDDALAMVTAGTAHAAILVGGQPLGAIQKLDRSFSLVSIPEATMVKLKNVYKPAKVNYTNIGAAGVQTVSTDALLVVREYKTPKMVASLSQLRKCILDHVGELSETIGMHPSWSKIDVKNQGKWAWYDLPDTKK